MPSNSDSTGQTDQQTDPGPAPQQISIPSLWLYAAIVFIAVSFIGTAFALRGDQDWPGLLLNVGSGLIGSVVVIVVVDKRLRASELSALRSFHSRTGFNLRVLLSPTLQIAKAYSQSLLLELQPQLLNTVERPTLATLTSKIESGFMLLGEPKFGKTVWMRQMATQYARHFLDGRKGARIIILVRLGFKTQDETLPDAIANEVKGRTRCTSDQIERLIRSGLVIFFLDGYDEIPEQLKANFVADLAAFRSRHPICPVTVSSRPVPNLPMLHTLPAVMAPPTDQEIQEMRRRLDIDQENNES